MTQINADRVLNWLGMLCLPICDYPCNLRLKSCG
jgi:hypothetical protein